MRGIVLCREEEASEASSISPTSLLSVPIDLSGLYFSCTWKSNGFLGINNDSCEANIRGSINTGGIQHFNSPIIHHTSPTAQTQTPQPYQNGLLKAQVCLLPFTLQTVRTTNGGQLIA